MRPDLNDPETLRILAGLSVAEVCAFLGRSERTWRHWRRVGAPSWAIGVLRLRAGVLDAYGKQWRGWRMVGGELYADDLRRPFTPGDVRSFEAMCGWVQSLRVRINELEAEVSRLRGELASVPAVRCKPLCQPAGRVKRAFAA